MNYNLFWQITLGCEERQDKEGDQDEDNFHKRERDGHEARHTFCWLLD